MATDVAPQVDLAAAIDQMMHPYRGTLPEFPRLPATGLKRGGRARHDGGPRRARGGPLEERSRVGGRLQRRSEHVDFVSRVYTLHSQVNPLHPDLWPSAAKFEAEIVSMTAHMLNGDKAGAPVGSEKGVCGSVTSGGSESILLAMKTYRDWARDTKDITDPEIGRARLGSRGLSQGGPVFRPETAARSARRTVLRRTCRRSKRRLIRTQSPSSARRAISRTERSTRSSKLSAIAERPGHRPARRQLPGRILPPVGRTARPAGAAVRFPAPWRDLDVVRHAQVRLRSQGNVGRALSRGGPAAVPVLHDVRLARRPVLLADVFGQPAGRAERGVLGGAALVRRTRLPRRDAADSRRGGHDETGRQRNPRAAS